jgi:hypothetical protein
MDVEPVALSQEDMADLERQQAEAAARWPNATERQRELYRKNSANPFNGKASRGRPAKAKMATGAAAPKPKPSGGGSLTKASLHQMLEMASAALMLGERTRPYALDMTEIDALTDAWYEVIRLYPSMGSYFSMGNKLTAWGQALMITTVILDRKVKYAQSVQAQVGAGATYPDSGAQRNGQNNVAAPPVGYTPVFDSTGF